MAATPPPFCIGAVAYFAFEFVPEGWLACDGQSVSTEMYSLLFQAIGYQYGGSGGNFNLPDLRGRQVIGAGDGLKLGTMGGAEEVALTADQLPAHTHQVAGTVGVPASTDNGSSGNASGAVPAVAAGDMYASGNDGTLYGGALQTTVGNTGSGAPMPVLNPYVVLNPCIYATLIEDLVLFMSTIMPFAYGAPQQGWLPCDGSMLNPSKYQALYSLLGTTFGGNGSTTFGLPNLNGNMVIGSGTDAAGNTWSWGQTGGAASATLTADNMPAHTHNVEASIPVANSAADTNSPDGAYLANSQANIYAPSATDGTYLTGNVPETATGSTGISAAIDIATPSTALNYWIYNEGVYPDGNLNDGSPIIGQVYAVACNDQHFQYNTAQFVLCNGQQLPLSEQNQTYDALFSLIGNKYGGNGETNFCVPNFAGCSPIGMGQGPDLNNYELGGTGGNIATTLTAAQLPPHDHTLEGVNMYVNSSSNGQATPANNTLALADASLGNVYTASAAALGANSGVEVTLSATADATTPVNVQNPFVALTYLIAYSGVYPPRQ